LSFDAFFTLALASLATTCLAAIGARSLAEFSRHELEEICRRRKTPDSLGQILRHYDRVGLGAETLQVIGTTVFVVTAGCWAWIPWNGAAPADWRFILAVSAGGALCLLATEMWVPWAITRLWASQVVYYAWPLWRGIYFFTAPLTLGARIVDTVFHRLAGRVPEEPDEESFEDEIRTIVTEGHREGLLEEDAREMIEGVIELSDVDVSEIMTPRTDMVSVPSSLSWQEVLEFVIEAGHTRIPVYEANRDDIMGVLVTKDLLPELAKGPNQPAQPWTALLREAYFVPETKPVDVLLQEFQRTGNHLAVVLDEYGGVSGLVTMEDVLEEIVGDIVDEYDQDLGEGIKLLAQGVAEVPGKVRIDEINERLEIALPDTGDFDTIGGFVFSELGHVPLVGEELVREQIRITVIEATQRRILRVRIEALDQLQQESA
jgi:CBS domain containing-hemolysin-like protein